jgi:hypothetical protein
MPYLLSLLPPQSKEEKLNPIPLVAKLHCSSQPTGSLYVRVLGGSNSRGGIALDPLVSSGRLSDRLKVEFAQQLRASLPAPEIPRGVHIQLEVVQSMFSNPGWTATGQPQLEQDMQKRRQELEISGLDGKRRTSFRGMKFGLFSAGSEGGFLVGEGGVVPWLCRTPGSKVKLQITKVERQLPVSTIQDPFLSTLLEQERYLRFLRQRGLVVKKNVVFADDGTWSTRSVVSKYKPDSLHRGKSRGPQQKTEQSTATSQRKFYPAIRKHVTARNGRSFRLVRHGPRKYSFRARASWSPVRPGGFRRSDHRPGGNLLNAKLLGAYGKAKGLRGIVKFESGKKMGGGQRVTEAGGRGHR